MKTQNMKMTVTWSLLLALGSLFAFADIQAGDDPASVVRIKV
jgi:hypothetical protein